MPSPNHLDRSSNSRAILRARENCETMLQKTTSSDRKTNYDLSSAKLKKGRGRVWATPKRPVIAGRVRSGVCGYGVRASKGRFSIWWRKTSAGRTRRRWAQGIAAAKTSAGRFGRPIKKPPPECTGVVKHWEHGNPLLLTIKTCTFL